MHSISVIAAHHDIDHMDTYQVYLCINNGIDEILPGNVNFMHNDRIQNGNNNTSMPNEVPEKME